jgi:U3 small nucleolar RNA-associated protein 14
MVLPMQTSRNEFEEQSGSEVDEAQRVSIRGTKTTTNGAQKSNKSSGPLADGLPRNARKIQRKETGAASNDVQAEADTSNPFLSKARKEKTDESGTVLAASLEDLENVDTARHVVDAKPKSQNKSKAKASAIPQETTFDSFLQQRITAADEDGWATVVGGQDDDDDNEDDDQANVSDDGIDRGRRIRRREENHHCRRRVDRDR